MSGQLGIAPATGPAEAGPPLKSASEYGFTITLHSGDHCRIMNYREAFVFAHDLLKRLKFAPAAAVFASLCQVKSEEPRANILLALCEAGLSQYSAAFNSLNEAAFSDDLLAADIYDAIVESRMGFKDDAIEKVLNLATAHTELPTLCLWLGDMCEAIGQVGEAVQWLNFAIVRDYPQGAVASAARRQINRMAKANIQASREMVKPSSQSKRNTC